jgi:hypothetical protein
MNTIIKSMIVAGLACVAFGASASDYRFQYLLSTSVHSSSGSPTSPALPSSPDDGWESAPSVYGAWTDTGVAYSCSDWSPSVDTIATGVSFTQTATDCNQDQIRTVVPQRKNTSTGVIEPIVGGSTTESQTLSGATSTQSATGTALAPTVSMTAPDIVFSGVPFDLTWTGQNVSRYLLYSNVGPASSGIGNVSTGPAVTSYSVTPVIPGSYTYTVSGRGIGNPASDQKTVTVAPDPVVESFLVNGETSTKVVVGGNLWFTQGPLPPNTTYTGNAQFGAPISASLTPTTTTYAVTYFQTYNGYMKKSPQKIVTVNTVFAPRLASVTASNTTVTVGGAYSVTYSGRYFDGFNLSGSDGSSRDVADQGTVNFTAPKTPGSVTYAVTSYVETSNGRVSSDPKTVTVNFVP